MTTQQQQNADFCGSIPLHVINHIQSYGMLIVTDRDLRIRQVSENFPEALGTTKEQIVERLLADLIQPGQALNLRDSIAHAFTDKVPMRLTFSLGNRELRTEAFIHFKEQYLIVEVQSVTDKEEESSFSETFSKLKFSTGRLAQAQNVQELMTRLAAEIKLLTGFEKVMIYRFDEAYNGTVVAEETEAGMEPYMGLKFPASDIPKQARDLYMRSPYRIIPDVEYKPVKLFPVVNPITYSFTDLSGCNVRSIAAVHLEYLRNMKVSASMSIRILYENRLWGLIACHHRTPRKPNFDTCAVLEILSDFVSSQLGLVAKKEEMTLAAKLSELSARVLENVYKENDIVSGLLGNNNLLSLLNLSGLAVYYNKRVETIGNVPSQNELQDISGWMSKHGMQGVYTNDAFPHDYERASKFKDTASGIMIMPIAADKGEYIVGFRPEMVESIHWGGNPDEALTFEPDQKNYHPRHSFKIWKEEIREKAIPFTRPEIAAAEALQQALAEFITKNQN